MKISNRILITVGAIYMAASLIIVALVNYDMRKQALIEAESKALILLNHNLAAHDYFSRELKPKLFSWSATFRSPDYFEPTWMSSTYAVRRMDHYFKSLEKFKYYYKECAINARNPENEADPEERAFLKQLHKDPQLIKRSEVRTLNGQPFFIAMRRGEQMVESCLRCHSTPDRAPGNLVKLYGPTRSFGRRVGEEVHAISIRIPLAEAYGQANRLSWHLSGILLALLGCLFASQTWISKRWLFDPMAAIRHKALEIAESEARLDETIPMPAGRELQDLTTAFNTMSTNLRQSHDSLEERVRQRTEDLNRLNEQLEQDIRKREQAEETLRHSETRFRELFDNMGNAVAVYQAVEEGEDFVFLDVNRALERSDQICKEDLVGRRVTQAFPGVKDFGLFEVFQRVWRTGTSEHFPLTFYQDQRISGWRENYVYKLPSGEVVSVYDDITQRMQMEEALRESEERNRTILRTAMDGFCLADLAGRFLEVNDAYCRMSGYSRDELLHMNVAQVDAVESQVQVEEHIKKVTNQHGDFFETVHRRKDGSTFPVEVSVNYLPLEEGRFFSFLRDITARQQAENKLANLLERLELALQGADLGAWDWNVPTGALEFNERWAEMLGYRKDEMEPHLRSWEKLVHPGDMPEVMEVLNAHLEGQTSFYETEHRLRHKSGEWVWVLSKGKVIERDAQGRPRRACGTHLDITRRKRLEESLEIERQELKLILDSAPMIIFYKDREGRFLRVNKAIAVRLNLPEKEHIGKTVFDLYPAGIAQGMANDDEEVFQSGLPKLNIIEQYVSASGLRWVQTDKVPIYGENGAVIGLVGFAQDITEHQQAQEALRESEERFRTLVENIDLGITLIGPDYRIKMVNPGQERFFHKPASEFTGKECFREFEKRETVCPHCPGAIAMATGRKAEAETQGVRDDGSRLAVRIQAFPHFDAGGEITGFIEVVEDITPRLEAETARRESEDRLHSLYETVQAGIILQGADGMILHVNQVACDILGWEPDEIMGKISTDQVWEMVFEDGSPVPPEEHPSMITIGTGKPIRNVVRGIFANNPESMRWLLINTEPILDSQTGALREVTITFQDITSLKQAQDALAEEAIRRRLLVEQSRDGIVVLDQSGKVYEANQRYAEMLGYSAEEARELYIWDWDAQWSREELLEMLRLVDATGDHFETRHRRKDGAFLDVEISTNGAVLGGRKLVFCVCRDISLRKAAEAALAESLSLYKATLESTADGLLVVDLKGRMASWNQKFMDMWRIPGDITASRSDDRALAYVLDQLKDPEGFLQKVKELYHQRAAESFDNVYFKDGRVFERYSMPQYLENQIVGRVWSFRDITARRQAEEALRKSEEKYRLVFEKAPLGIMHYDQTSTITDSNEMFAEIIGAPMEKFIGFNIIRQLRDEKMREAVAASLEGEVGYYEGDYRSVTAGKLTPVRAIYQPLFSLDGVLAGGVGIFEDITERRKAEAERLHFSKLESLATLAGGIAHDFNNILTAIMGNISLAKLDPYEGQRLADAENACLRAKALALQLLTFAKGGAPIKELISVARLVTETGSFACRGSNVRCEFSLPDNLWAVNADPSQLGQVSHNLVINAMQAMPTGGAITIQGENLVVEAGSDLPLDPGKYVKISIQDQGLGIPAEHLPRIFDPYFTTKQMGSGLGLATAYSIIKAHQGHIAVESTLGKGTIFQLYLPAAEQKLIEQIKVDKEVIKGEGKILVMDDEEMVQEIIGKMLGYLGYKVMFAGDGEEAVELYTRAQESREAFDAVILDLTVPGGMGGKAAMEKLLQIDPQVKAIVSSGYSEDPIMAEFASYGFSGVIAKPYRISELSKVLHKGLSTGKRGDFHDYK